MDCERKFKVCIDCNINKPLEEFPKRKNSPDGHRNTCNACIKIRFNIWKNSPKKEKEILPEGFKRCTKCKEIKSVNEFGKSSKTKDGLKTYCKECRKKECIEYRKKHPETGKEYREKTKERRKKLSHERYKKVKDTEEYKQKCKEYNEQNEEKNKERKHNWYERNKPRIMEKKKARYHNDPAFRLVNRLRGRTRCAIRRFLNGNKKDVAIKYLGCTIQELMDKFEEKFYKNKQGIMMSWENFEDWHVDHIIPLSSFNLDDEEHLKIVCHNSNLQPLWAEDNLKKGNRTPQK